MVGPIAQLLTPPYIEISWTATAFGSAFQAYRVYRRPARNPVLPWKKIAEMTSNSFLSSPATIEAQHTKFRDFEAGWYTTNKPGQWATGWDYAITVQKTNGLESVFGAILAGKVIPGAANAWVTCNTAPYLNAPLRIYEKSFPTDVKSNIVERSYIGRDYTVTRTPKEIPSRRAKSNSWYFDPVSTDQVRHLRAVEKSGRAVVLNRPLGDRITGTLTVPSWEDLQVARTTASFSIVETDLGLADYNSPLGFVTNGTSQFFSTPSNALLNPGTGPFTIFEYAAFVFTQNRPPLSKGDLFVANTGYGFGMPSANTLRFFLGVNADDTSGVFFDGAAHVAVGVWPGGTASPLLYRDGALTATGSSGTPGTRDTALAFVAGADNGGTAAFAALSPLHAWGYYPRALTATEVQALSYYLLAIPGYRMPPGANAFYDLRDTRAYQVPNVIQDLSGNGLHSTATASPTPRGRPWELSELEAF